MLVLGLMSGTSADGIDAALCEITGSGETARVKLRAFECAPYAPELRERVLQACANQTDVREVARLNVDIAEAFAAHANAMFARYGRAELIGSHGQTVCHLPAEGVTLQVGDGCRIAERTGVAVVSDFRQRDLACGGQGAPLVPYADWVTLRHPTRDRAVLNIGGIANVTILPAACALDAVRAWDTGPGNMVIDFYARQMANIPFDRDGALARQGANRWGKDVHLLSPYFARVPPKSCGREEFGDEFARRWLSQNNACDNIRSATELTARSIADSLREFGDIGESFELIVSGGGARNATLMELLRVQLPGATVKTSDEVGVPAPAREAMAFALLAAETYHGNSTSVVGATGARATRALGKISET